MLNGSDCINGNAFCSDHRTTGLNKYKRKLNIFLLCFLLDNNRNSLHIFRKRLRGIRFKILNAESSAEVEFSDFISYGFFDFRNKINHNLCSKFKRRNIKYLRTDMAVKSAEVNAVGFNRKLNCGHSFARLKSKAEFRINLTGSYKRMRMRIYTGFDSQHYLCNLTGFRSQRAQPFKLLHIIDNYSADIIVKSHCKLIISLIVAVETNTFRRETGLNGGKNFSARNNV